MKFLDLWYFSFRDLLARRWGALGVTIAIWITIWCVCLISAVAYGLAFGSYQVQVHRLQQNPLAKYLTAGDSNQTKLRITEKASVGLASKIEQVVPGFKGCFPFRVCEAFSVDKKVDENRSAVRGRTIRLDLSSEKTDPLMKSLGIREGRGFKDDPEEEGVIITPLMMEQLGLERDGSKPRTITFNYGVRAETLHVLAVTERDLPSELQFVIPENLEQRIVHGRPDPRLRSVCSGIMPGDWPEFEDFPKEVSQAIYNWNLEAEGFTDDKGNRKLYLASHSESIAPRYEEWRIVLRGINELMQRHTRDQAGKYYSEAEVSFEKPDHRGEAPELDAPPSLSKQQYDVMGMYFENVDELKRAAIVCEEDEVVGQFVDQRTIRPLEMAEQETRSAVRDVTMYQAVVVFVAVLGLAVIQTLRAWQKNAEAGMLKVMGVGWQGLIRLVFAETAILWLAAPAGIVAGTQFATRWFVYQRYVKPEDISRGFDLPYEYYGYILGISFSACLLSAFMATLPWHFSSPARLLRSD